MGSSSINGGENPLRREKLPDGNPVDCRSNFPFYWIVEIWAYNYIGLCMTLLKRVIKSIYNHQLYIILSWALLPSYLGWKSYIRILYSEGNIISIVCKWISHKCHKFLHGWCWFKLAWNPTVPLNPLDSPWPWQISQVLASNPHLKAVLFRRPKFGADDVSCNGSWSACRAPAPETSETTGNGINSMRGFELVFFWFQLFVIRQLHYEFSRSANLEVS